MNYFFVEFRYNSMKPPARTTRPDTKCRLNMLSVLGRTGRATLGPAICAPDRARLESDQPALNYETLQYSCNGLPNKNWAHLQGQEEMSWHLSRAPS